LDFLKITETAVRKEKFEESMNNTGRSLSKVLARDDGGLDWGVGSRI